MNTIRRARPDDAAACADIYAPYVYDSAVSFEETPPSGEEMRERLRSTLETYPWLVCERENRVVGFAYASDHRNRTAYQWSVELSIYVDNDHRRTGIATGLYESLFAVLDEQGFYNGYAGVTLPNRASVAFHREMGFEPVGTYENVGYTAGEWQDVQWWRKQLRQPEDDPEPPVPISAFSTAQFEAAVTAGVDSLDA
ncbi:arsinothricin resistance N-acetyltransferase ArsN1 family B [Halomicrobium sp. LC1Hm]|uniref:arsinothricin resistance N-acetyltransferase ArsN1 family B n=1 Tax=Halomicrobium sp. LC1Hm TaxID=2610902 RepID=UPI00129845A7|nr:arsinothricin resistance N-acetyltransferase ArsN1 family B [Halomicrobium sp. LC1Hm]QGA82513.1 Sortase or related acyltransferase [Halomicrobium sp. LC1Hm]